MDGIQHRVDLVVDRCLHGIKLVLAMDSQESAIHTAGRILSDRDTSEQSTSCARKEVSEVVAGMGDNGTPVEDVKGLWPYTVYGSRP